MPVGVFGISSNPSSECMPAGDGEPDLNQAGTTNKMDGCASYPVGLGTGSVALVRMVPGVQNCQLIGEGITQCDPNNITNQYQCVLSLSGNGHPQSIVLSPVPSDCQNKTVTSFQSPASPLYLFSSRNVAIARCSVDKNTFSPTCTVTAAGLQGETEIIIVNPRACNSMFTNAQASPTAGGQTTSLRVIVLA